MWIKSKRLLLDLMILAVFLSGFAQPVKSSTPLNDKEPSSKVTTANFEIHPSDEKDIEEMPSPEEKIEETIITPSSMNLPTFSYPDAVRGIYVTSHSAGGSKFSDLLKLVNTTDLNAMVIDIKDDYGWITYKREGAMSSFSKPFMKNPKQIVQTLKDSNIYTIARIVVFKDSILASESPELSFKMGEEVWKNQRGEAFVNPFMKQVWEHNVAVAKEAAKLGFQEIQFDYVRFPEGFETRDKALTYSMGDYTKLELEPRMKAEWEKEKAIWEENYKEAWAIARESQPPLDTLNDLKVTNPIFINLTTEPPQPKYDSVAARVTAVTDFVEYAKKELEPFNVKVSVDIFGYTATLTEAPGIGQNFLKISSHVDVISSMIYPSHWGQGYFNISDPDTEPYRLVQEYVKLEKQKLAQLEKPPVSRPWIQDFTASWLGKGNYIPYGAREVELQIRALNEEGIQEFLIWNAGNNYSPNVDYTPLK